MKAASTSGSAAFCAIDDDGLVLPPIDYEWDGYGGVTAAFDKNVLARINRELGGHFDLDAFEHVALGGRLGLRRRRGVGRAVLRPAEARAGRRRVGPAASGAELVREEQRGRRRDDDARRDRTQPVRRGDPSTECGQHAVGRRRLRAERPGERRREALQVDPFAPAATSLFWAASFTTFCRMTVGFTTM